MTRTLDATFLNTVANHPEVRPFLGGVGALDLQATIGNINNITVQDAHGGFIAIWQSPGVYDIHSLFLPEGRGAEAMALMREGLEYLFLSTDALLLTTNVPSVNPAASALAKSAGFVARFVRVHCWPDAGGPHDVMSMALTIERWAMRSEAMRAAGEAFHADITAAAQAFGRPLPAHSDDGPAHDHAAGVAYALCLSGQPRKAEDVYNLWARAAGYDLMHVLSEHPMVIDVGAGVVGELRDGKMELLSCQ